MNAKTDLAAKFPTSPLENLHLEVALEILSKPESDIFRNVDMNRRDSIRQVRGSFVPLLFGTVLFEIDGRDCEIT